MDKFLAVVAATMVLRKFGPDGWLYATCGDNTVYIFNLADCSLFHKFGFNDPRIVRFDRDGNLKFGTWSSLAISVYTPSGVLVRTYTPPSSTGTAGLFIDRAGNRLVGDPGNPSKVVITDKNNNLINKLATGEGRRTYQVAISPNGDVWVTYYANKILIYSE